jgi:hypothetical protein
MITAQVRQPGNLALVLDDSLATGRFVYNLLGELNIPARSFKNPIRFLAELRGHGGKHQNAASRGSHGILQHYRSHAPPDA